MNTIAAATQRNFFVRCWLGSARLWQAFWLVGVLGKFLVLSVVGFGGYLIWRGPQDTTLVNALGIPLLVGYVVYASVSIWRCAPNTNNQVLGGIARVLVAFGLVSWALVLWRAL